MALERGPGVRPRPAASSAGRMVGADGAQTRAARSSRWSLLLDLQRDLHHELPHLADAARQSDPGCDHRRSSAVGMTFVIATGGIDLSVGSLMAIAGALRPADLSEQPRGPLEHAWVGIPLAIVFRCWSPAAARPVQRRARHRFPHPADHRHAGALSRRPRHRQVLSTATWSSSTIPLPVHRPGRPLGIPVQVILMLIVSRCRLGAALDRLRALRAGDRRQRSGRAPRRRAGHRTRFAVYGITGLLAGLAGLIVIRSTRPPTPIWSA